MCRSEVRGGCVGGERERHGELTMQGSEDRHSGPAISISFNRVTNGDQAT